jgi:sec-independent protein translocase protein TatB
VFDINGGEMLILLVVAVVVIGPERLPKYAEQLAGLAKRARAYIASTRERVDSELGGDSGVDWAKLDPRQYDPRRIVRDALLDDDMRSTIASVIAPLKAPLTGEPVDAAGADKAAQVQAPAADASPLLPAFADPSRLHHAGVAVPFDDEAT